MEILKPVVEDTAGTKVTLEEPYVPDFSENALVLARSLSRLLEGVKEDKTEMPTGEITPVETPVPSKVDTLTTEEGKPPPNPVVPKRRVESVVDTSLPTEAKAFLDTISLYEARDYDIIVGEGMYGAPATFTDFSKHPNVIGMRTVEGPSTAAGRYQFVYSTWQELQRNYPGQFKDFNPITQDRAAWRYAQDVYKQRTGKDLLESLRSGNIKTVQNSLRKIWIGFGLDKNVADNYAKALSRYTKEGTIVPTSGPPPENKESTLSEFIAPARERHQSGVEAVNAGDYSGVLNMVIAYPELAARFIAGSIGELSGYVGQDKTQQRKLSRDIMGMMESTAGLGGSFRVTPKSLSPRTNSISVLNRPRAIIRSDDVFRGSGEMNISIPDIPTKPYAIRRTGVEQLEDMIKSGLIRPKPGGYGKTKKATIYFGEANTLEPSFAAPAASETHVRLIAKSEDLAGHKGPIPIDKLQHIYALRNGKEVDILDEVLRKNNEYMEP